MYRFEPGHRHHVAAGSQTLAAIFYKNIKKMLDKEYRLWYSIHVFRTQLRFEVGVNDDEGPPVPIPNTVVKLIRAENTWREAARKDRSVPTQT